MSYSETAALAKEQEEAAAVPRDADRHRGAGACGGWPAHQRC